MLLAYHSVRSACICCGVPVTIRWWLVSWRTPAKQLASVNWSTFNSCFVVLAPLNITDTPSQKHSQNISRYCVQVIMFNIVLPFKRNIHSTLIYYFSKLYQKSSYSCLENWCGNNTKEIYNFGWFWKMYICDYISEIISCNNLVLLLSKDTTWEEICSPLLYGNRCYRAVTLALTVWQAPHKDKRLLQYLMLGSLYMMPRCVCVCVYVFKINQNIG